MHADAAQDLEPIATPPPLHGKWTYICAVLRGGVVYLYGNYLTACFPKGHHTRIRLTSLQNYKIATAKEVYRHALGQVSF